MKTNAYLLVFSFCLSSLAAKAQLPYTLSTSNQAYQHLAGTTSVNNSLIWNYQTFIVPIGFPFRVDSTFISTFDLFNGREFTSDTVGVVSQFLLENAPLFDKGNVTSSQSLSAISYVVTGTAPYRIFKAEVSNAGFHDEFSFYNTTNDSLNMQIWLYEGYNIVELRYGPSHMSYDSLYFPSNAKTKIGYVKNYNFSTFNYKAFYILSGNAANPGIDSIITSSGYRGVALSSFPANGTVYRFTPTDTTFTAGIRSIASPGNYKVFPTLCSNYMIVEYDGYELPDYKIISVTGKETNTNGKLQIGATRIDINKVSPGMYLLEIQDNEDRHVYRFIKQ